MPVRVSRAPGRLVGEDQLRTRDERPGDRDPLLLAARQLARQLVEAIRHPHGRDDLVEPRLIGIPAGERQRQEHVLARAERRDQVVLLEDEPEPVASQQRQLRLVQRRDVRLADERRARRQPIQAGDALHQRALARPRRAHDRRVATGREVDADAGQRMHSLKDLELSVRQRRMRNGLLCGGPQREPLQLGGAALGVC